MTDVPVPKSAVVKPATCNLFSPARYIVFAPFVTIFAPAVRPALTARVLVPIADAAVLAVLADKLFGRPVTATAPGEGAPGAPTPRSQFAVLEAIPTAVPNTA